MNLYKPLLTAIKGYEPRSGIHQVACLYSGDHRGVISKWQATLRLLCRDRLLARFKYEAGLQIAMKQGAPTMTEGGRPCSLVRHVDGTARSPPALLVEERPLAVVSNQALPSAKILDGTIAIVDLADGAVISEERAPAERASRCRGRSSQRLLLPIAMRSVRPSGSAPRGPAPPSTAPPGAPMAP
jgi:hypothetical protein